MVTAKESSAVSQEANRCLNMGAGYWIMITLPNELASQPIDTQQFYGELRRSPRNDTLSTPSGLEGSSGSSGFVCRGAAGAVCLPPWLRRRDSRLILNELSGSCQKMASAQLQ